MERSLHNKMAPLCNVYTLWCNTMYDQIRWPRNTIWKRSHFTNIDGIVSIYLNSVFFTFVFVTLLIRKVQHNLMNDWKVGRSIYKQQRYDFTSQMIPLLGNRLYYDIIYICWFPKSLTLLLPGAPIVTLRMTAEKMNSVSSVGSPSHVHNMYFIVN